MRILVSLTIAVLAASLMPAMAQDTCYVVECWPIPGGQRCLRHCFHPQPEHYAPAEEDDTEPVYQEQEPEDETPEQEPQEETPDAVEPPPAYESHDEPEHYAPQPGYDAAIAPPNPPIAAVLALLIIVIGVIIFGSAGTNTAALRRRIAKAEHDATTARNLGRQAERGAQEIDGFIEHSAREHFERGRQAADKEWTRG